ncbi:MAG: hypothetical protein NTX61_16775 [Bacteroidetes bacterium]|nr:hypothetical protein [Bacteroidota bacterium]
MTKTKPAVKKPVSQKTSKNVSAVTKKKEFNPNVTLLEQTDSYLDRHMNKIFWGTFFLTILFGILLFDIRFSLSGDDSTYVIRAYDFIHQFIYPGFQGPLYPIVLSPLVIIFGIKAIPLKCLSLLFILGFMWFLYKAFRNRIPSLLLTALLILVSINSFILYYASQTYSETFFMFLQSVFLWFFFTYFIEREKEQSFRERALQHLLLALCVLSLGITRSIGFSAVLAVSGYFILKKQWKNLVFFIVSFALVLVAFQGLRYLLWGNSGIQFSGQGESLLAKDYYAPDQGREDLPGFINRLFINSDLYISKYFYIILGLRENIIDINVYPFVTVLTWGMLIASVIRVFRKNKYLLFTGIYSVVAVIITFLVLQTNWEQLRLIIPWFPLLLLMLLAFFYYLSGYKRYSMLTGFLPVLILILFIVTFVTTISKVKDARQITDRYYGLTPDWENYCKLSEWASLNLPQNTVVACRKPSISFMYGNGKRFYGITQIKSFPGVALMSDWRKSHGHPYLISSSSLTDKPLSKELYEIFTNGIVAYWITGDLSGPNIRFYVVDFSDSVMGKALTGLRGLDIHPTDNIDSLKPFLNNSNSGISIVYPDTLLNLLLNANVTHVIKASLRGYSAEKTNVIINTVERFMDLIERKYPKILTILNQTGEANNEPAAIYSINYDQYRLK